MSNELSAEDRRKILKLGLLTQELALLQDRTKKWRAQQRVLLVDLVQRECISQARASRISELSRQTISSWVNVHPADYKPMLEDADAIIAADPSLPDDFGTPSLHPHWRPGLDPWTEPPSV